MFFLTPRYVKQGKHYVKEARKQLAYRRDIWSEATVAEFDRQIKALEDAVKSRNEAEVRAAAETLDKMFGEHLPPRSDSAIRENVEVFVVAIVVALGVRTYFLQPFTIPTGSMQPTLNGIIWEETKEEPPNLLVRTWEAAWRGRTYVNLVARADGETVTAVRPLRSPLPWISRVPGVNFGFFDRAEVETTHGKYVVKVLGETVARVLGSRGIIVARKGEPLLRGYFDAGDHVFVDKVSYHFVPPKRDDIFVFSTLGIHEITPRNQPSQFYIKRLAGLPGDTLQIRPPELFINGQRAQGQGFEKVMSGSFETPNNDYRGYSNGSNPQKYDQGVYVDVMRYLGSPTAVFEVPQNEYFALGDNSFNSRDSRDWGTVPEKNIMGRALMVYWPFAPHFGLRR